MTDPRSERYALFEEFRQLTEAMANALDNDADEIFLGLLDRREDMIRQLDENALDLNPGEAEEEGFRALARELTALDAQVSEKLNRRVSDMRGEVKGYRAELNSLRNLKRLAKSYSITVKDEKGYFVDKKK